jgi:hypothetical protein
MGGLKIYALRKHRSCALMYNRRMHRFPIGGRVLILPLFGIALAFSCTAEQRNYGTGGSPSTTSSSGAGGTAGSGGTGGAITSSTGTGGGCPVLARFCQDQIHQCGNGIDDDEDGLVDSDDPDCVGVCDDTESTFNNKLPGTVASPCLADCYFDPNAGTGNDECYWNYQCDSNEVAPNYWPKSQFGATCAYDLNANTPGTAASCTDLKNSQSQACLNYCGPLVPNGCDCFGCCELPAHGGKFVYLGSEDVAGNPTCDVASVNDPSKCHPCEPVPGCFNACEPCERCVGDLGVPAGCSVDEQCGPGVQRCGEPGQECCQDGFYCVTGCCMPVPL